MGFPGGAVLSCFNRVQLCDSMDCSLPGSSVHGILQAKILEWAVISSIGDLPDRGLKPASLCLLNCQEVSFPLAYLRSPPGVQVVKNPPANAQEETRVQSLIRKTPWRKKWQPTPVFLTGKFHGQRSLADYSPWGC